MKEMISQPISETEVETETETETVPTTIESQEETPPSRFAEKIKNPEAHELIKINQEEYRQMLEELREHIDTVAKKREDEIKRVEELTVSYGVSLAQRKHDLKEERKKSQEAFEILKNLEEEIKEDRKKYNALRKEDMKGLLGSLFGRMLHQKKWDKESDKIKELEQKIEETRKEIHASYSREDYLRTSKDNDYEIPYQYKTKITEHIEKLLKEDESFDETVFREEVVGIMAENNSDNLFSKKHQYEEEAKVLWKELDQAADKLVFGEVRDFGTAHLKNAPVDASLFAIGMDDEDVAAFLRVQNSLVTQIGKSFTHPEVLAEDLYNKRYRAYYEARRTGKNVFTHVSSADRFEKIAATGLKSSNITSVGISNLKEVGQTGNIEDKIYFTSGGGGYHYGTKVDGFSTVPKEVKDFLMFAATGNDILASGRSIEVATPGLQEKNESIRGVAVAEPDNEEGTILPINNLQIVIPESEKKRYEGILLSNGYNEEYVKDHFILIPDAVLQEALSRAVKIYGKQHLSHDDPVLQEYFEKEIKGEVSKKSKYAEKIFATTGIAQFRNDKPDRGAGAAYKWIEL